MVTQFKGYTLSIFFNLEINIMWVFSCTEGVKAAEDLENLLMAIIEIDLAQQEHDHNALC
jgi:hypothetical protein